MSQMMNDLTAKIEGTEPSEESKSGEGEKGDGAKGEGEEETATVATKTEEESSAEEKKDESTIKGVYGCQLALLSIGGARH